MHIFKFVPKLKQIAIIIGLYTIILLIMAWDINLLFIYNFDKK